MKLLRVGRKGKSTQMIIVLSDYDIDKIEDELWIDIEGTDKHNKGFEKKHNKWKQKFWHMICKAQGFANGDKYFHDDKRYAKEIKKVLR